MIAANILELIGHTPIVRLNRIVPDGSAEVLVKLEGFNPAGSTKDRIALAMIEAGEAEGTLRPGDTVVEPSSGNTGIGLALVCAVKGYALVITMPDDASLERRRLLEHYGARIVLTPAKKLMQGAIDEARAIVRDNARCFMPQQFDNPANPRAHRERTAREILEATEGRLDAFVAGVGTGGTLTGVGRALRDALPDVHLVAVEPERSQALAGKATGPHGIQGLGAGFVPSILDRSLIDEILACPDRAAYEHARKLARLEGISAGFSGGAAVCGALRVAARLGEGKRVLAMVPDCWERYVSVAEPGLDPVGLDFVI